MSSSATMKGTERGSVALVGLVQAVVSLDSAMIVLLRDHYAREFGIATSQLGVVSLAYVATAVVAGLAVARTLDRFDRRVGLVVATAGVVTGTVAASSALSLATIVGSHVLAGFFAGPAVGIGLATVSDIVPIERRGTALGVVLGARELANVLGVPIGLELGRRLGWRVSLHAVAALGLAAVLAVALRLPSLRGHLTESRGAIGSRDFLRGPGAVAALTATLSFALAAFAILPHLNTYFAANCAVPREKVGQLLLAGGVQSFVALRVTGRILDARGASRVALVGAALFALVVALGFGSGRSLVLPPFSVVTLLMLALALLHVSSTTLASRIPLPQERAGFQSVLYVVELAGMTAGSWVSSALLTTSQGGALLGMPALAALAVAAGLSLFWTIRAMERALVGPEANASSASRTE